MGQNWDNIILVGMPGSGKSTIGMRLAKELGYDFVDGDRVIEERHGKSLKEIIAERGNDGFSQVESDALCSIRTHCTVIAPGGSVCYEPEAIAHLRSIGTIIFLNVSYRTLKHRLGDLVARGVVLRPGMTLQDLYDERVPLYQASADMVLEEGKRSVAQTVAVLKEQILRAQQGENNGTD